MDWSRAKSILILTFLSLNIVLGYQLWASRAEQSFTASGQTGIVEETERLLKNKGIHLSIDIPREVPKLQAFTVQFDEGFPRGRVTLLKEPFKWQNVPTRSPHREQFLKQYIQRADAYQFDPVSSTESMYVFTQMVGPLPMFDVKLELTQSNGDIVYYRQSYVEILLPEEQEAEEQRIIPAYTAVRSLAENVLPKGATIIEVKLGYHISKSQFMFPSWRVATTDGQLYYFNALNGAVEVTRKGSQG